MEFSALVFVGSIAGVVYWAVVFVWDFIRFLADVADSCVASVDEFKEWIRVGVAAGAAEQRFFHFSFIVFDCLLKEERRGWYWEFACEWLAEWLHDASLRNL